MAYNKIICPHCKEGFPRKFLLKPRFGNAIKCPKCKKYLRNSWKAELLGGLITGSVIAILLFMVAIEIISIWLSLLSGILILVSYITLAYPLAFRPQIYDAKTGKKHMFFFILTTICLFILLILYVIFGALPLIIAANRGNLQLINLLITMGADPNVKNDGITSQFKIDYPLESAILSGQTDVVKLLIDKGADINVRNRQGGQPIHLAVIEGDKEIVSFLLSEGADPNARYSSLEATPLMIAADSGYEEIAKILIEKGAIINVMGKYNWGMTPLMLAAQNCNEELVRLFLTNGADESISNDLGQTAYSISRECKNKKIMQLLLGGGKRRVIISN